jgi:hypothetical protein
MENAQNRSNRKWGNRRKTRSGSAFPIGTTTNTFLVTDAAGNTATCSFDMTVTDNEEPICSTQNITVQLDATGNATITTADIDNCGIATLALNQTDFDCNDVGANTVTLTVTDNNGNISTCTANVTVQDNVNPLAVCQNLVIQLDATGNASITSAQ